jgi:hypothetical protein
MGVPRKPAGVGASSTPSSASSGRTPDRVIVDEVAAWERITATPAGLAETLSFHPLGLAGRRCRMDDRENLDTLATGYPDDPVWRTGVIVEAAPTAGRGWTVVVLPDDDPTHPKAWQLCDVELTDDDDVAASLAGPGRRG